MTQLNDSRPVLIDEAHLRRQTMGDGRLADELLGMFVAQLGAASREMAHASPQRRIALAHSLKGTARSLGVQAVAECSSMLEAQATDGVAVQRLSGLAAILSDEVARRGARPG